MRRKCSSAIIRVPSHSQRTPHITQKQNMSTFNSTLSEIMSIKGRSMWNIARQIICLQISWRKDFLTNYTNDCCGGWASDHVSKPLCHHELRTLEIDLKDTGAWKLQVGVKNYAILMATPMSDFLILAIQTAICLKRCFNNCKDGQWGCEG